MMDDVQHEAATQSELADLLVDHIQVNLQLHRVSRPSSPAPPLFVCIQGPQGSGKSTVTRAIDEILSPMISVVCLSLDDLYLPRAGLVEVASRHGGNPLLQGRGQPGTHDIELGQHILQQLQVINEAPIEVELPCFDKSLHNGEGDRLPPGSGLIIKAPVDVVILEGWCLGFYPLEDFQLEKMYSDLIAAHSKPSTTAPNLGELFSTFSVDDIKVVNAYLRRYSELLYPFFSVFAQIAAPVSKPYEVIYTWRLQQEHHMKKLNGGRGMADTQVKSFIDRYIPSYVLFQRGIELGYNTTPDAKVDPARYPPWKGRQLRVTLDEDRNVTAVEHV